MLAFLLALHLLAAIFWVGGMAFAYWVLRPAAGPLDPPLRLPLWRRVFERFLPWVGVAIVVLLGSGYAMLSRSFGGFAGAPIYVNVMQGLGWLMVLLYLHLLFAPWKRFRTALDAGKLPDAAAALNQIRQIVAINLALGIAVVIVGGTGRYW
ncbi:MAG TPA: CopD family protein [Xanthobacteraceae bacterium]|nr:CopD family protein [Xanthobacteraceae bacterium]